MRPSSYALLLVLLVRLEAPATGQTPAVRRPQVGPGVIAGSVVAAEDGSPLASASVAVRRMADSTVVGGKITDRQGRFRVEGLPVGSYMIQVSLVGKGTIVQRDIAITAAATTADVGAVRLAAAAVQLQGIVARGQAPPMRMASDRTIYSLQDMPVAAGGVATDVLRTVPDIEVDVEGKVTAMGASPAVHLNGRPAPMQGEALTAFLQNLPADRIDRIEYIPNPSARYEAEGQGGILNIVLKENVSLGLSGTLTANTGTQGTHGGSGRINYQEGRLTFFGGATGNLGSSEGTSYNLRENRLSLPITFLEQDSRSSNQRMFGAGDATLEWKLSPRATLWSGLRASLNGSEADGDMNVVQMNAIQAPTLRYDRLTASEFYYASGYGSLGYRNVTQAGRDEYSGELRFTRNGNGNENDTRTLARALSGELLGEPPLVSLWDTDEREDNVSFQTDLSRPWGETGRVDIGYRGSLREIDNDQVIEDFAGAGADPVRSTLNAFDHRELFNSVYATVDRKIGKAGIQLGLRAERADTRFSLPLRDESFENDYVSLFPSANLSYEVGQGRQLRLSYSKRFNRPPPFFLNPINRSSDPLNQQVGNPHLKPSYTHSVTLESSWNGAFGSFRLAPYYRREIDVWDQLRIVDASGVSTVSMFNLASAETYGSGASLSLRQLGPVSGLISAQGYRQVRDGSNLSNSYSASYLSWSSNANLNARITPTLNAQLSGFYNPERRVPQGTISSFMYLTLGARQQLFDNKIALNLSVVDPFNTYKFRLNTSDTSHTQITRDSFNMRRASLSVSYNFGRPPQSSRRQGGGDEPPMEMPGGDAGGLR